MAFFSCLLQVTVSVGLVIIASVLTGEIEISYTKGLLLASSIIMIYIIAISIYTYFITQDR